MPFARIRLPLIAIVSLVLGAAVLASGCRSTEIRFVEDDQAYDAESVMQLFDVAVPASLASADVRDAARLRQAALTDLRGQGGVSAEAAELLTATFTAATIGVPYYVERATYEGEDAWLVLEARGPKDGTLSGRRLWVLRLDGDVILSTLL
ncbi:MAG: hypothetical protein U1E26_10110 [Coriobacteriia bacterium]|nr:hypothetical protein [Coriobacteriia bacterium]